MGRGLGKHSLASQLFWGLTESFGDFADLIEKPQSNMRAPASKAHAAELKRHARAWKDLERAKYIEIKRSGSDLYFTLTNKGFQEILKRSIISKKAARPDGFACYVSFDIPEDVRHLRDALRLVLKDARFVMIHQSLWMCKRDIATEFAKWISLLKAEKFVHVFLGAPQTPLTHRSSKR